MNLYLGLDGGGTKTVAALIDEQGQLVAETIGGASNPYRLSLARAMTALDDAGARALAKAKAEAADVFGVTAGVSGAGRPRVAHRIAAFLCTRFREASVETITDLEIALDAVAETGPGVVVVAGTGSAAFGRDASGRTARAGGWGPWFSDEGGAFDIACRALTVVSREHDAGFLPSPLGQAISTELGHHSWQRLVDDVLRKPHDLLPRLFPPIVAAAEAESESARAVLSEAACSLASLAEIVIGRLGLCSADFVVGLVGGVFGRSRFLDDVVAERVNKFAPSARLVPAQFSPAVAAARRALRRAAGSSDSIA